VKVAVVITGQMRDYKVNCVNHIKHIIKPNNADVFVYACSTNTLHTTGPNITQKYVKTTKQESTELEKEISDNYGKFLKQVVINENENLDDSDFGTLGYFKRKMNNQMSNIREGFKLAKEYSAENGFDYDVIVRLRPDNSMFLNPVLLNDFDILDDHVYSTVYPSGHRDPWFFSFSKPTTFEKYCSFIYMDGEDESRTDNDFDCPEIALEKNLASLGIRNILYQSICRPFYQYDKTKPITFFPHVNLNEKLIDAKGNFVPVITEG